MIKDNYKSVTNIPQPSFDKNQIVNRLLTLVDCVLPTFQHEFAKYGDNSERELTQYLINSLDYYSRFDCSSIFLFRQETIQKQSKGHDRYVDIGVFMHYKEDHPFFSFEAKCLPTIGRGREKEYVKGSDFSHPSGGIERYKLNLHGVGLSKSAMIAYVKNDCFENWYKKINLWITELSDSKQDGDSVNWDDGDRLRNICVFSTTEVSKFLSSHDKVDKSKIDLYHYFINIQEEL